MFDLKPLPAAMQRALSTAAIAATVIGPQLAYAEDQNPVEAVAEGVRGGHKRRRLYTSQGYRRNFWSVMMGR